MKKIRWGCIGASVALVTLSVLFGVACFSPKTAASKIEPIETPKVIPMMVATSSIPEVKKIPVVIPQILLDIAYCESGNRQFYANGSLVIGRIDHDDRGRFQINRRYHGKAARAMGLDLDTDEGNTAYALALFKKEGTRPWLASKKCWTNIQAWRINRKTYY